VAEFGRERELGCFVGAEAGSLRSAAVPNVSIDLFAALEGPFS
jgi:hypothetical protein